MLLCGASGINGAPVPSAAIGAWACALIMAAVKPCIDNVPVNFNGCELPPPPMLPPPPPLGPAAESTEAVTLEAVETLAV